VYFFEGMGKHIQVRRRTPRLAARRTLNACPSSMRYNSEKKYRPLAYRNSLQVLRRAPALISHRGANAMSMFIPQTIKRARTYEIERVPLKLTKESARAGLFLNKVLTPMLQPRNTAFIYFYFESAIKS
jgi:hypothetical protein